MQQLVGTRNEDMRYDFLLFIGRVLTSCLPDLYLHNTLSRYRLLRLYFRCLFNAVHTIRTCKSFQANDFQDRFLTTRTHGRRDGHFLFHSEMFGYHPQKPIGIERPLTVTQVPFSPLRQILSSAHPSAPTQSIGFEPIRPLRPRISNSLQYLYGNSAFFIFLKFRNTVIGSRL